MQFLPPAAHLKSSIFQRISFQGSAKMSAITSEHVISKGSGSCSCTYNVDLSLFKVVSEDIPGCSTLSISTVQEHHWVGRNQTQRAIIATPSSMSFICFMRTSTTQHCFYQKEPLHYFCCITRLQKAALWLTAAEAGSTVALFILLHTITIRALLSCFWSPTPSSLQHIQFDVFPDCVINN